MSKINEDRPHELNGSQGGFGVSGVYFDVAGLRRRNLIAPRISRLVFAIMPSMLERRGHARIPINS